MLDRVRALSNVQKVMLGFAAVLTTFCALCCGCIGLIALLPSDENEAVTQATSEIIEAETVAENVLRESAPESAAEPANPPKPTNAPPTAHPATASPIPTNESETGHAALGSGAKITGESASVTRIIDGDTIEVYINGQSYRVRYIGMDTPERGDPFFEEATEANRQLVECQTVTLVKDVSETDRYGRLLRYVYLPDGIFVNAELVRQGYAQVATFPPDVAHQELFVQLQQEARDAGLGLWNQPAAINTPLPSQTPQPTNPPIPTHTPLPTITATAPPPPTSTPEPAPTAVPAPATEPVPTAVPIPPTAPPPPPPSNCDPSYPTVCIPPPPPDLDCGQIPHRNFTVLEPDPHGFDRDNDGIGCES